MTPSWILDILAGVMLLVAAISAGRLVAARAWAGSAGQADIDVAHLLMGIAMAGMLVAGLTTLPNGVWDAIFAMLTAWFGWRVYRESRAEGVRVLADGHRMPHLVHSAAMLYMFAALNAPAASSGGGMSGMGSSGMAMSTLSVPVVAFIFALWLSVYVVLDLDCLSGPGHTRGSYFAVPALAGAMAGTRSVSLAAASVAPGGTSAGAAVAPEQPSDGTHPAADRGWPTTGSGSGSARSLLFSPQLAAGCRIAMGVTMTFMLIIMI
jgi:Domain of unknown function (DUF5134)